MKRKKKEQLPKVEPVKIKPLFGLRPGIWLTAVYAAAFVLVIFLIGFLPGIIHGSKRVVFTSAAHNAAVYIDGNYAGGTPFTTKVKSGTHSVTYSVNGHELDSFEISVGHPVFFTWLVPRYMDVNSAAALTESAYKSLVTELFEDLSVYSLITEYDSINHCPPLFTDFCKSVQNSGFLDTDILDTAVLFISSSEMLEDARQAFELVGYSYDFSQIEAALKNGAVVYEPAPAYSGRITAQSSLSAGGVNIRGYTIQDETGDSFNMARLPVTEDLYTAFVRAVPKWAPENRAQLVSEGLADSYYLADVALYSGASASRPVKNVSYHAAQAFCEWLSKETGRDVFLPSEAQWVRAALTADTQYQRSLVSVSDSSSPVSMLGGLWELTSTFYVPLERDPQAPVQAFLKELGVHTETVVKGGSYINSPSDISIAVAGTSPQALCSDFMGFRVAWI